jgi:hypothetical protein
VNARDVAQDRAGGGEGVRDRGEPAAEAGQALLGGGERAGQQRVQQRAGVVVERVPLVFADRGQLEEPALHDGREDRVVDLVLGAERIGVDAGQRVGGVAQHGDLVADRARGQVGHAVVEAVVARGGRQPGIALQDGVDDALG